VFKNRQNFAITTGTSGACTVVINPYGCVFGAATVTATQSTYPFIAISSSNTGVVYNGASMPAGPFFSQQGNIDGYYPDQLKVSFLCTQSSLNAQGKITASVYYQPPNVSFLQGLTGTFDATTTAITSTEMLNSM